MVAGPCLAQQAISSVTTQVPLRSRCEALQVEPNNDEDDGSSCLEVSPRLSVYAWHQNCFHKEKKVGSDELAMRSPRASKRDFRASGRQYIDSTELERSTEAENSVKYHQAWHKLCKADGILVPGGFGIRGTEGKLQAISWARTKKKPFLGVCLGMQLAVVEFARNCLNWKDANSTEFDPDTKTPVVIDMPEHNPGDMGGTMRLGKRRTVFKTQNSVLRKLYGDEAFVEERHRHRYEVNPELTHCFEEKGLKFVGHDTEGNRMEIIELENHPYFVGVQFHPEFSSRPMKPSPPYLGLLLAATGTLNAYLQRGCKLSPSDSYSDLSDDSSPEKEFPNSETS
ncbi:PREDICTED: CTP synthase 2-like [Phaethon lepturus]|uniref:CTP synthase 2-like n=1 Tax=Phaethon lepturus TaxID=97097 RepID=UPI000530BA90|nr:PREDICTED: CTP synthase 2-like [Phaethon lepturus]